MTKRTTPLPKRQPAGKNTVTTRFKTEIRPPRQFFRQWREYREMTQGRAAELTGMTVGNISAMETGRQGYSAEGLQALANAYKTSPGWLLEVDPTSDDFNDIMDFWNRANETNRKAILSVAQSLVGKTGTTD